MDDLTKIEPMSDAADPERCQSVTKQGQCTNKGCILPDGTRGPNCRVHGGNTHQKAQEAAGLRHYRLSKWRQKIGDQASSSSIKNLREEVGILRVLVGERLELCDDRISLMTHSAVIADLVTKIDKLVNSCHKLEGSLGELLDRKALLQFSGIVVNILMEELVLPDVESQEIIDVSISRISERLTSEVISLNVTD